MRSLMRKNVMPIVALIAAIVTTFFVSIDRNYLDYFETTTLMSLFCILAVVSGLEKAQVLELIALKIISFFGTARNVVLALTFGIFVFDLVVANDMSLITFLPLTYIVLSRTNNHKYVMITFIMQTIAANMAGMIVPHGNPQNLFIYAFYNIPATEFVSILLPEFIMTAVTLLAITFVMIPNRKLEMTVDKKVTVDKPNAILYAVLTALTIISIFRVLPVVIPFILIACVVVLYDRKTFIKIDFGLLMTFCFFFVFAGNMARIPAIQEFVGKLVDWNTLITGLISTQFISNVPTAIFLSKFTENYTELLVAVNLGALGTMVSSLATLITLKEYLKHNQGKFWKYLGLYTVVNTTFFLILMALYLLRHHVF